MRPLLLLLLTFTMACGSEGPDEPANQPASMDAPPTPPPPKSSDDRPPPAPPEGPALWLEGDLEHLTVRGARLGSVFGLAVRVAHDGAVTDARLERAESAETLLRHDAARTAMGWVFLDSPIEIDEPVVLAQLVLSGASEAHLEAPMVRQGDGTIVPVQIGGLR